MESQRNLICRFFWLYYDAPRLLCFGTEGSVGGWLGAGETDGVAFRVAFAVGLALGLAAG
jgi:hypothetical protein